MKYELLMKMTPDVQPGEVGKVINTEVHINSC